MTPAKERHSEIYLSDVRYHMHNDDYLNLLKERFDLGRRKKILDVGCGQGHWTTLLARMVAQDAEITGVDREPDWIERAEENLKKIDTDQTFTFQEMGAYELDFPDNTFDVVSCQTLLIHLKDPEKALKEMVRVLVPGGRILCMESDLSVYPTFVSTGLDVSVDDLCDFTRLYLTMMAGKKALGEGDLSFGAQLYPHMERAGVKNIHLFHTDKVVNLAPPYSGDEAQAWKTHFSKIHRDNLISFTKPDGKRLFTAAGGSEEEFEKLWNTSTEVQAVFGESLEKGTLHKSNHLPIYIASGEK